jgi:hypothetical protein
MLTGTKTTNRHIKTPSARLMEQANSRPAAADEAIIVALNTAVAVSVALDTAVADPDSGKMSSLTISGDGTTVDITGTISGSDSPTVDSGAAPQFNPIWHGMAGTVTGNQRLDIVQGKLGIAAAASETGMSKADEVATLRLDDG